MPLALVLLPSLALIGLLAVAPSLPPRTVHRLAFELACIWAAVAAAAALYTH
ncbi:hypothetical protein [Embleya sp. NPDC020630]|uniref:hypothetical protein n=1 Tax=Embleya sp. NPDC020630 TaxID=3363979 RepID=UPI0037AE0DF9